MRELTTDELTQHYKRINGYGRLDPYYACKSKAICVDGSEFSGSLIHAVEIWHEAPVCRVYADEKSLPWIPTPSRAK